MITQKKKNNKVKTVTEVNEMGRKASHIGLKCEYLKDEKNNFTNFIAL